jgi:peptidoglycan hydrolase-like protein with peptidoglycan-binding domain
MCFGHKEWAPSRKIDPRGIDMDLMRAKVAEEQQSLRSPVEQKAKPDVSKKKEESSIDDFCKKNILKLRSRGSCVKSLQEKLNGLGINVGKADGIFGNKTLAGVKTFQARNGLKADGIVGPRTWAKLV